MLTLKGEKLYLRALEPEDLEFLHELENNEEFWEVSATQAPFSKFILKKYLENSHLDIYEVKQLRLVICNLKQQPIGLIDIFDFEPRDRRAAIGILIAKPEERQKGFGAESLSLVCKYCFKHLGLHQVYANITADNERSLRLFENRGFSQAGLKKEWTFIDGRFKDEYLYQLINKNVH
ncbi:GNAT family N-acetyltransferase [Zunongwangia endophytica]|uniref:GNAT family N-acetyltransferase n=1 Tax=Zunongwangia endophytica TaxID=1808945 RepID=A0ABV8HFC2_9FLAO|nr:GNAT family N-acetyltransferase [Zunongwangia endophytica]MDN3596605.1 GNAT family N-acetyltransferase [Zunongwangia endophytica]